jgi:hypothetical protein
MLLEKKGRNVADLEGAAAAAAAVDLLETLV